MRVGFAHSSLRANIRARSPVIEQNRSADRSYTWAAPTFSSHHELARYETGAHTPSLAELFLTLAVG